MDNNNGNNFIGMDDFPGYNGESANNVDNATNNYNEYQTNNSQGIVNNYNEYQQPVNDYNATGYSQVQETNNSTINPEFNNGYQASNNQEMVNYNEYQQPVNDYNATGYSQVQETNNNTINPEFNNGYQTNNNQGMVNYNEYQQPVNDYNATGYTQVQETNNMNPELNSGYQQVEQNNVQNINQVQNAGVKSTADLEKLDHIFKAKSKNEKLGLYGLIASFGIIAIAVIYGLISGDSFYVTSFPIIASILVITCLVIYLISFIKRKKLSNRPDIDIIKNELLSDGINIFEKSKVYLTENYIVSHGHFSSILKYNDIALIYNERIVTKAHGTRIDNGIYMRAYLLDGKKINIMRTYDEPELQMVGQIIKEHNPNILFGMNPENKAKLKEIQANYKNSKK